MASGATSINDLPSGDKPNITLETQDPPVQSANTQPIQPAQASLSNEDINKIISGIQTASQQNLTSLPSRDIPMNTINEVTDKQVQPNFVPENKTDYIQQHDTAQTIYEKQLAKERTKVRQDEIYDELQTPIMIAIMFLLSQLPVVNKTLFRYIPTLFVKDGTPSFGGHLFKSISFGVFYFVIMRLINYMSDI